MFFSFPRFHEPHLIAFKPDCKCLRTLAWFTKQLRMGEIRHGMSLLTTQFIISLDLHKFNRPNNYVAALKLRNLLHEAAHD